VISFLEFSKGTKVRGYITVGELDNVCYENSQTLAAQLQARNLPCKLEIHPDLGHEYPLDFEKVLTRALEFILCD
jgi:predicted esterase